MTDLALIRTLGRLLDDLEHVRILNSNRIGAVEREYGAALPHLTAIQIDIAAIEKATVAELQSAWRNHPLAPWAGAIPGCGEKLIARLIAEVGDPAERETVGQLFAYCGHGEPKRKPRRGMTQEEAFKCGNPHAKKRVHLLAVQFRRTPSSPYRLVYEARREATRDRVHDGACVRCGPAGRPAAPGSPWSLGHQDADALRIVGKAFLEDLWRAARAIVRSTPTLSPPARANAETPTTHRPPARAEVPV